MLTAKCLFNKNSKSFQSMSKIYNFIKIYIKIDLYLNNSSAKMFSIINFYMKVITPRTDKNQAVVIFLAFVRQLQLI